MAEENIFRILVTSDNHIGYMENDPVRGDDSLNTFEEILQTAVAEKVDFILLGGDLFHHNKPSRKSLYHTMRLIRKYCFGAGEIPFNVVSDQKNFHTPFESVNYEDPNLNIKIPIFTIHGNHDDPGGEGSLSAMDILSVAGMVNYFGKSNQVDKITISPLLMEKGTTRLALYGLGNIRDERLYNTFHQNNVHLLRPEENQNDWFSIMMLHQNRVHHSPKNFIDDSQLADFLDLVIWGHEHCCLLSPQASAHHPFLITQPGSTVATSLVESEANPTKKIGILSVMENKFRMKEIELKTVRPFITRHIVLTQDSDEFPGLDISSEKSVSECLAREVESMIEEAKEKFPRPRGKKVLPLIRLRVEHREAETCNVQRFGQQFVDKVANTSDILLFTRRRGKDGNAQLKAADFEEAMEHMASGKGDTVKIEDLVEEILAHSKADLDIIPSAEMNDAMRNFVEKEDKEAIKTFLETTLKSTQDELRGEDPEKMMTGEAIESVVKTQASQRREESQRSARVRTRHLAPEDVEALGLVRPDISTDQLGGSSESDGDGSMAPPPKRGRGRGAKKAPAKKATGRGRGRGRAKASAPPSPSPFDSPDESVQSIGSKRARRGSQDSVEPRPKRRAAPLTFASDDGWDDGGDDDASSMMSAPSMTGEAAPSSLPSPAQKKWGPRARKRK